ncbi:hypothetical protein HPB50_020032 [Hyalomma asiaticum]|uniref:Uncharacterized protein n=1 Tax=Hyalomma asiaticum TaxID=266040 RepID=A0ACB7SJK1_HYAAI|nr:hypothetical protein HPB50_020032 [Hyalomma asiaticum]
MHATYATLLVNAFLKPRTYGFQNASSASWLSGSNAVTLTSPNCTLGETEAIDYGKVLRDVVTAGLSKVPPSVVRKLLAANVRPKCRAALLRTMKAWQNFEPWVLRLIDATGKYPTGFFEGSCVDMGAFDQCLETTVRDQYGSISSRALLYQVALAFSAKSNTRMLLNVAGNDRPDLQSLQFFHGTSQRFCEKWSRPLIQRNQVYSRLHNFCLANVQRVSLKVSALRFLNQQASIFNVDYFIHKH